MYNRALVIYTVLQKYTQFCLFMMSNAYVPEGGNEGGREDTVKTNTLIPMPPKLWGPAH